MPKLLQRLLIFFIGIPLVIFAIIPQFYNHLPLHILIFLFTFMSAWELTTILSTNSQIPNKILLIVLSMTLPVASFLCGLFNLEFVIVELTLTFDILIIFTIEIFSSKDFSNSNIKIANGIFTIIYSGFLITFISRLATLKNSSHIICLFVILVFISDSAAWLFGMLFGKNNRGLIAASPNKSIAGFIGAYLGSIGIAILIKFTLWKEIFGELSLIKLILLAICVTTTSIIGDLAESVFKRSSGCKDSGNIILGRGGALDSIDSLLASAPFYFLILKFVLFF